MDEVAHRNEMDDVRNADQLNNPRDSTTAYRDDADRKSITLSIASTSASQRSQSPQRHDEELDHITNQHNAHLRHSRRRSKRQPQLSLEPCSEHEIGANEDSGSVKLEFSCTSARPKSSSSSTSPTAAYKHHPMLNDLRKATYALPTGTAQHKVRTFNIKKGHLVSKGNRYIRPSPSRSSMLSVVSSSDSNVSVAASQPCKILLLGASGVGKRALIHEFNSPDSTEIFSSMDDDTNRSVSILLDGQESTMEFVDMSDREVDEYVAADQIDAYVVVYSVEDHKSFETAINRLYEIRQEESKHVALILVANKTDLVRTRIVHEREGRAAAKTYDCKYIEVSAAIDHRIDELLIGILKQIRLVQELRQKMQKSKKWFGCHKSLINRLDCCCFLRASSESVIATLFGGDDKQASKSCDNLYVL